MWFKLLFLGSIIFLGVLSCEPLMESPESIINERGIQLRPQLKFLGAKVGTNGIVLKIRVESPYDVLAYELERSRNENAFELIEIFREVKFTSESWSKATFSRVDTSVEAGNSYIYRIRAYYKEKENYYEAGYSKYSVSDTLKVLD